MTVSRRTKIAVYAFGAGAVVAIAALYIGLHIAHGRADERARRGREDLAVLGPVTGVVLARPAPATRDLELPAEVLPYQQVMLYAKVAGYLGELRVDRGDRVKRGELLGVVTAPETDRQLAPLRRNLATREAIANRLRPLVPAGVVTQQSLDQADADVQAARSEVDRLAIVKSFDQIVAPFDGVVTQKLVDVGALLPAATGGTTGAQPLVQLADTSRVRIVVYVGQREATQIREGDRVAITHDADPLHPIGASVTRISRTLDPRTRTMAVEIDLANADHGFYPGELAMVKMTLPAPRGVVVPADAIVLADGKPSIAIVDGNKVRLAAVTIADEDGRNARAIAGVRAGEMIVAHVGDEIVQGKIVRPRPVVQQAGEAAGAAGNGSGSARGPSS